jgi:pyruvate kinase
MKKKLKKSKKNKKTDKANGAETALKFVSVPPVSPMWDAASLKSLIEELHLVVDDIIKLESECNGCHLDKLNPAHQKSGQNLVHYLALRRHDLRAVQEKLAALGLSSLGRAEPHVMSSIVSVLKILRHLAAYPQMVPNGHYISFSDGGKLLWQNAEALFGPKPAQRSVRIMVTVPSEAGEDYMLVRDLLVNGMDCMRINCAHDNPDAWERMLENLKRAKKELGKKCRVLMDLGGPKLRTGPIEPTVPVIKWRPKRDQFGRVLEPARIWLKPEGSTEQPDTLADTSLSLPAEWLDRVQAGEILHFTDARGASRKLKVVSAVGPCRWAESSKACYLTSDTVIYRRSLGHRGKIHHNRDDARVGAFSSIDSFILLRKDDILILTKDLSPGKKAEHDKAGRLLKPATIGCSLPEVFKDVRPGERIWMDDGKIGGIIKSANSDQLKVKITNARPDGEKLRGEKGINLPDSNLRLSALSERDAADLKFIAKHADMVGMSFAQDVADIARLQAMLAEAGKPNLGIVLKIETRKGFEMLPDLLLAAMRSPVVGVMIARGDLAVECGYQRLAEVQEEILWICEAAHLPVIWATQVLEGLAKKGIPSRAEITDAAMSERAECVMLNKGPYIIEAMQVLDNILQRMESHHSKKSPMLKQLRWWEWPEKHLKT